MKVRICVAIDEKGNWNALGWSHQFEDDTEGFAIEPIADENPDLLVTHWVEADVPVPSLPSKTIQGRVDPGTEV